VNLVAASGDVQVTVELVLLQQRPVVTVRAAVEHPFRHAVCKPLLKDLDLLRAEPVCLGVLETRPILVQGGFILGSRNCWKRR
jgi:hypothetical protein